MSYELLEVEQPASPPPVRRMSEADLDAIEAAREDAIALLTRLMMRDPNAEALDFVADCNAHLYPELVTLACKVIYAGGELTRLTAIADMAAFLRPQFETAASYKLLETSK